MLPWAAAAPAYQRIASNPDAKWLLNRDWQLLGGRQLIRVTGDGDVEAAALQLVKKR